MITDHRRFLGIFFAWGLFLVAVYLHVFKLSMNQRDKRKNFGHRLMAIIITKSLSSSICAIRSSAMASIDCSLCSGCWNDRNSSWLNFESWFLSALFHLFRSSDMISSIRPFNSSSIENKIDWRYALCMHVLFWRPLSGHVDYLEQFRYTQ